MAAALVVGDVEKGIQAYYEALRTHPRRFLGWLELARLLDRTGNFAEAVWILKGALTEFDWPMSVMRLLAKIMPKAGMVQELYSIFLDGLRNKPRRLELYKLFSELLAEQGQPCGRNKAPARRDRHDRRYRHMEVARRCPVGFWRSCGSNWHL